MENNKSDGKPTMGTADVRLYPNNKKGILLISDNKFFMRLWFFITNPFRYIFTGKIRY